MTVDLSPDDFERLVEAELDALPEAMTKGLVNVAFVVLDSPEDAADLFGEYDGIDITQRGDYGFGELPDRIMVYRLPHLAAADSIDALRTEVRTTLVHEIGHFHGIDDDRLHELGWA